MSTPFFRPVKPFSVNQGFGENNICVSVDGNNTVISCDGNKPPKGYKSLYGPAGHLGLDLYATHGQGVYNALDGVVYKIDTNIKSGLDVRIESEVLGVKYRHIYEHLLGYQPKVGDKVKSGDLIGWADNTGYSSGNHLHFQIEQYIKGKWVPIDPATVLSGIHAQDIRSIQEKIATLAEWIADLLRKK